jgi:hypothetical protein
VKDPKIGDDPSTTQRITEASAQEALIQPSGEHHTIQLEATHTGVTSGGIAGTIVALGQLNIVVSNLPIHRIEELQAQLVQEIRHRGNTAHQDLVKLRDESTHIQMQYDMALWKKKELEDKMEEIMKTQESAEERETKSQKEKDDADAMVQRTQVVVQKLYKQVPEVPLVVEATMEEQLLKIGDVMKRF